MKNHYWHDKRYNKALITNFVRIGIYPIVQKEDDYQAPIILSSRLDNHLLKSYLTSNKPTEWQNHHS